MISNICIYNNKLLIPVHEGYSVYIVAYSYQHKTGISKEIFREHSRFKLPEVCSPNGNIWLKVVDDFKTEIKCCLILVSETESLQAVFLFSDAYRNKLVRVSLPQDMLSINVAQLFVTHGPMLLTKYHQKISLFSLNNQAFSYIDDNLPVSKCKFEIVQFSCIGTIANSSGYMIVYVTPGEAHVFSILSYQDSKEFKSKYIPIKVFFPEQYCSSIKAVSIVKCAPICGKEMLGISELSCTENLTVIFRTDECLIFENGILMSCCKVEIQFPGIMRVDCDIVRSFSEETLIVRAENGQGCLIAVEENNCKVSKQWDGIKLSAVGHLMLNGSKQIILLNDTDLKNWHHNYRMIDVSSFIGLGPLSDNPIRDECLKATLAGIQEKVQAGKAAIIETTNDISRKSAATVDALTRLLDYKSKPENIEKSKSFRESLVDLILNKDENKYQDFQPAKQSVKLLSEKNKFVDDECFLCFKFINESSRSICHPNMVLVVKAKQIQSVQKVFLHTSDSVVLIEETCSQVDPEVVFTLSVKISISSILDEKVNFVLTWHNGTAAEYANEILMSKEEKTMEQSQMSFWRTIRCSSLLEMKTIQDILTLDDLHFVLLSQTKMVLLVLSLYSDLGNLRNSLLQWDPSVIEIEGSNHLVFSKAWSHLFGVNFSIIYTKGKKAALEVFCRNHKETLLFVHFLYQHLPDVIISPIQHTEKDILNRKQDMICGIKDEIDLILSSMRIHNVSDDLRKNYSLLMSSKNVGNVTIPKDTYQRIRRALVKKEIFTDNALKNMM